MTIVANSHNLYEINQSCYCLINALLRFQVRFKCCELSSSSSTIVLSHPTWGVFHKASYFLCPALAEHTVFVVSVRNGSRRVRSQRKSVDWGTMGRAFGGAYECYAHISSFFNKSFFSQILKSVIMRSRQEASIWWLALTRVPGWPTGAGRWRPGNHSTRITEQRHYWTASWLADIPA